MGLNEVQKKERSEYLERNLEITECSQRKPYAFVSYASDNWETVFKSAVVPLQRQYGMRVYADKAFDKVNDRWIVPMLRNIRGADVVIAFVSQSYIESYACFLELLTAVNNKKQIVFVSLEQELHLGDTTDQPDVEQGVKKEILNQGSDIATNTNNTSNDLMRAMKSAYTSISTLLEQDALSKYDISDAFINFFRDASINRKTINDLKAVKRTISSISREVFDKTLISRFEGASVKAAHPAASQEVSQSQSQPAEPQKVSELQSQPAVSQEISEPQTQSAVSQEISRPQTQSAISQDAGQPAMQSTASAYQFDATDKAVNKKKPILALIAGAVCCLIVFVIMAAVKPSRNTEDTTADAMADGTAAEPVSDTENKQDNETAEEYTEISVNGNVYEGYFTDGVITGKGKVTYANGDVYEGELADGVITGQGKATYANGNVYEGEWQDNYCNGHGTMKYANGDVYEGEWQDGYKIGQGTYTWADGTELTGTWEYVTKSYDHGEYEGESADGKRNGWGIYTWDVGAVYEGEWRNGDRYGYGKMIYPGGSIYEGEWKDHHATGQGTYTWADGTELTGIWEYITLQYDTGKYEGDSVDGIENGWGKYTWTEGDVYEGEFKDGYFNGFGTMTWADGTSKNGTWANGEVAEWE